MSDFTIKDSGKRLHFDSGMVRDVATDKTNVSLVFDGPMFWRWAVHLTKGATKYAVRNWMQANGEKELERFRESAARHFFQWYRGDVDEDHASAVFFNINGAEYVKEKLNAPKEVYNNSAANTAGGATSTLAGMHSSTGVYAPSHPSNYSR